MPLVHAIDEAIESLDRLHPQHARVMELQCYGGLPVARAAETLGISPRAVKRDWAARAWLRSEVAERAIS
jgi:DNA-directed RNA polymerase specialized sigma24 family protein